MKRYTTEIIENIDHGKGYWKTLKVGVFLQMDDEEKEQLGIYERNYSSFLNTFYWFTKNDKDYALYSPNYTTTRVMELPSCKDIGGEENCACGFCPVDFYVPWHNKENPDPDEKFCEKDTKADFGFVAGCVWGDDSSWKIKYLDLSKVEKGIIKQDGRFGRIHLPRDMKLKEVIDLSLYDIEDDDDFIRISHSTIFELRTGEIIDD